MFNAVETSDRHQASSMQYRAGGASPTHAQAVSINHRSLSWHLVFIQSQRSKLAPSVAEGALGASGEGLRWLASVNLWGQSWWNFQGSLLWLCWFLQWQSLLGFSTEQVTVNHNFSCCVAAIGNPCFTSLFLTISISLSFVSLGEMKSKWDLCAVP